VPATYKLTKLVGKWLTKTAEIKSISKGNIFMF